MKKFDIRVVNSEVQVEEGLPFCEGEIYIGDYKESFPIGIDCWSLEDFQKQWKEGLERLKDHDSSCLVIAAVTVEKGVAFGMFVLYKTEDTVFIQYHSPGVQLTVRDKIVKIPYDTNPCYELVRPRTTNEKGEGTSEDGIVLWETNIPLKDFMESLPITG